jgi:hypothetical protein
MNITEIVISSVFSLFIGAPIIVFSFILLHKRSQRYIEEMKYKRQILELELEKEKVHLKIIEAENLKYDRIIEDSTK